MSSSNQWIGISGYRVLNVNADGPEVQIEAQALEAPSGCPYCGGGRLHSKGPYTRRARHMECFGRLSRLLIRCRRYQCCTCRRSFVQSLPGVLKGRHSSEGFRARVYQWHHEGICASSLASLMKLGAATVERIYQQFTVRKANERLSTLCPQVLGIDEHTLHKGCRFATTFCDLKNRRVFDVVEGKSTEELKDYLLSLKGRDRVKVICIDLSSPYRALIRNCFPNARIVADRFHVVRIVLHHFMELFRQIAPEIKHQRGSLAALRTHPDRLSPKRREIRQRLFAKYPVIEALHTKMCELWKLLSQRCRRARQCRPLSRQLIKLSSQFLECSFAPLRTLGATLSNWAEEIACMWRFTKNNGITEGFHRKMKLIQRRAYGFRNFNNYRLRVIAQCG